MAAAASSLSSGPQSLAILISGRGSNMAAIAAACAAGSIPARVACVIADRDSAPGLATANQLGLETHVVRYQATADRAAADALLQTLIDAHGMPLVVLAGFMRILSSGFVAAFAGRLVNIHPSLLPAYKGLHTHRRVLAAREPVHGASVHYVTAELDGGPVVLQGRLAVRPDDDETRLADRVQACEHRIYPRAIGWITGGRLTWDGSQPCLEGQPLAAPIVEDCDDL